MAFHLFQRYRVRGMRQVSTIITLLSEVDDGFLVSMISEHDHYVEESEEFLPRTLLETCVRTGYLTAIDESAA